MPEKIVDDLESLIKKQQQDIATKKTPRFSISTWLFLSIMGLISFFVISILVVDTYLINFVYLFSTAWRMWNFGDEVNQVLESTETYLPDELAVIEKKYQVSLELFNKNGRLIYYSDSSSHVYGKDLDPNLANQFQVISSGDIGEKRHLEIQKDLDSDLGMEYIVFIAETEDGISIKAYKMKTPMDEGVQTVVQIIIYLSAALFLLALFSARSFSRRFTRSLKEISATAHNMATLDFSKRCPHAKTREVDLLSDSLNDMSEALNMTIEDLTQKNKKLQEDYEKEKTLENLRGDFITGVSHELKTPIAIIQGYAEGLEMFVDSDVDTAKQYASIIRSETDRMNGLVMKLLEIIKYDSGDYQISQDILPLYEMVQNWFDRNQNLLTEKKISCYNRVQENYVGRGDTVLINSVINNYLSNAVSHIDGEKKLIVAAEDLGDLYRVSVFNTGKNIADKDIDKIWNSFYRADKSLSRAEGRFGLGLTIVSSIQKLHDKAYGVENMPNGVRFWFDVEKVNPQEMQKESES